ncbi:MAG TPA: radical SAM protein, partial [Candidatus Eremiobacteraeota bacterium]|nr:radical SAM protein [Candidatus Eremiobacteraeota bacterium]
MNNKSEKKKILLISVPFSAKGTGPVMENHGLCYLKACLCYNGFSVDMIDGNATEKPFYQCINELNLDDYFLMGFSVYSTNYYNTSKLIKAMRASGFTGHITMGGHYPTFSWKTILEKNPALDSIVLGEGELILLEIAKALASSKKWRNIGGLACRIGDDLTLNPGVPLINPLSFPFLPDRRSYGKLFKNQNFATISSSRGCWGNCTFCSVRSFYKLAFGPCWRPRSPEEIVDELEYLYKEEGISNFAFCDDNFMGTGEEGRRRAVKVGEEILRRSLDIAYAIDCRPDDVNKDLLKELQKSGLVKVNIGVESFVERQLRLYSKTIPSERIESALDILKELDFFIGIYTIFFDPSVTFEELSVNLNSALRIGPEYFPEFATFLQVFPGIPLYDKLKKENFLDTHKILQTTENEYWINYRFQNPGIEDFFILCL